jgi:hypothetical protein
MKNTPFTQIVKDKKTNEILGYILPGETCLMSPEYTEKKLKGLPDETPENVVFN